MTDKTGSNTDIAVLAANVAFLMDRRAIEDCVHRHARGHDRFDVALLTAAYHTDGVDEHGAAAIHTGPEYAEWAERRVASREPEWSVA